MGLGDYSALRRGIRHTVDEGSVCKVSVRGTRGENCQGAGVVDLESERREVKMCVIEMC